jgi:hypothetical protein
VFPQALATDPNFATALAEAYARLSGPEPHSALA